MSNENQSFLPIGEFTKVLNAVDKTARFFLLWRTQVEFSDSSSQQYDQFRILHTQHLVNGCTGPIDVILRWLKYGLPAHKNTQKAGDFVWLDNMSVLVYQGLNYPLSVFPEFAQAVLGSIEEFVFRKMNLPASTTDEYSPAGLTDNIPNLGLDFSFLDTDATRVKITGSSDIILKAIMIQNPEKWKLPGSSNRLTPAMCRRYLRLFDILQDLLMVSVFVLGGQPPRGPELLSIQVRNTVHKRRNIVLYGNHVVVATDYHKGTAQYASQKIIPRFLPERLGRVLVAYLAHIRPFAILCQEHAGVPVTLRSPLLWPVSEDLQSFPATSYLTNVLRKYTKLYIKREITVQQYRQIAIKMDMDVIRTPRHLQDKPMEDDSESGNEDQFDFHTLQAAHSRRTEHNHYGVGQVLQLELQRSVWVEYCEVSSKWQSFLGVNDASPLVSRLVPHIRYIVILTTSIVPDPSERY